MRVIYGAVAIFLLFVAVNAARLGMEQLAKNQGVPTNPAQRQGYIIGLFIPPAGAFAAGLGCGYLAVRNRRKPDQRD